MPEGKGASWCGGWIWIIIVILIIFLLVPGVFVVDKK
ncbi:flagellar basal body-associated protein FliL [Thermoanaerobacterium butyriciformans]|uniref:Flagellar basal body-associated protein FliL n=1 Tax=Thermoanaerobacterium butyriciformans TaxID=1702242 RepID=A0ABS4NDS3_9THEO|nr:flagellar basal body-associated protein FliL [Thermoanaerobacterium butyriciformans]